MDKILIKGWILLLIQLVSIAFSVILLWKLSLEGSVTLSDAFFPRRGPSLDSPLMIFQEWDRRELLGLIGIFLISSALYFLCRRFKTSNAVPALVLILLILTHFSLAALVSVCLFALVACVIGRKVTIGLGWAESDAAIQLAAGYAILAGILQLSVHFMVNSEASLILSSAFALVLLRRETRGVLSELVDWLDASFFVASSGFVITVGVALSILVLVAFPETHSDALIANLSIAHQVQVNGLWSFATELNTWAAWPKAAAWLQTAHYLLAGEQGVRLFNGFVVIVTAVLILNEARRLEFTSVAWMAPALFMSTPLVFMVAFVMFDDAIFGFFVAAAIIAAVNSSATLNPRGLFLTLLLSAAAVATKITGMLLMPVILAIYLLRFIAGRMVVHGLLSWAGRGRYALAGSPLLAIAAVPYFYAYYMTGNPIFPLYNDIFQAENFPATRFQDLRWSAPVGWDIIYRVVMGTSAFMEGRNWTFGLQHALFTIPILLELVRRRQNIALQQYAIAMLFFSILVFTQMRYVRYLYPILPIYTLLLMSFLEGWSSRKTKLLLWISLALVIALNLINVKSLNMFYRFDLKSLSGEDTRRFSNYSEKSLNETVNLEYGTSARVLYLHRPYSAGLDGTALNYHWASPAIRMEVDAVTGMEDAFDMIRKLRITHIMMDKDIAESAPIPLSSEINSVARLQRQLGSSQLWKVDLRFVPANVSIKLNDLNAKGYLISGWREQEAWGVWAYGDGARFLMHTLKRDKGSPVMVRLFAMPYTPEGRIDGLTVSIYVNGYFLQEVTMKPEQVMQELGFEIPTDLMSIDDVLNIELRFPKAYDKSNLLQLGVREIMLEYR